jgi:4-hydroxybenzoate polyprenyltransferase
LPSGRISRQAASLFLIVQSLLGFVVLIQFNAFAIALGIASLTIVALYPFAKRFTDWPQFLPWAGVFLGRIDGLGRVVR